MELPVFALTVATVIRDRMNGRLVVRDGRLDELIESLGGVRDRRTVPVALDQLVQAEVLRATRRRMGYFNGAWQTLGSDELSSRCEEGPVRAIIYTVDTKALDRLIVEVEPTGIMEQ